MRKKQSESELFDEHYRMLEFAMDRKNPLAAELKAIDKLLDEIPEILELVHADINRSDTKTGRSAVASAEQILRSAILMQLRSLHYRQLADEIDAQRLYRKFTRFYMKKIPHFTRLNGLIKMISPETWEQINAALLNLSIKKKVENAKAIRIDTTVAGTDIAYPIDARLLSDSVRVMNRLLVRLKEIAPSLDFPCHDRTRRAKKRAYQIAMGKGKNIEERRRTLYKDLLKVQRTVQGYAETALLSAQSDLAMFNCPEVTAPVESLQVERLVLELKEIVRLARRVYVQAYRRVLKGEEVPAKEKLVSIFETHTDIICRGKKGCAAEFGHKIQFATGRSGLVTWYDVLDGNPGDNEGLLDAVDHHIETFGYAPGQVTADRRYYSLDNEEKARLRGVVQVALPRPGYLNEARRHLEKAPWFKRLMRWRSGIEGCLSTLLRGGMKRCLWKGWRSFKSFIGLNVLAYNLRLLACHLCPG